MGVVSNILAFREVWKTPTLVLVDLHDEPPLATTEPIRREFLDAMENCRVALDYARQNGFPVAFVRRMSPSPSFLSTQVCPSWIGDIRPGRADMVFERPLPSCYASAEFAQMARDAKGLVLAGLFGETSCLSTLIEGYGRSHAFIYLADASVSRGRDGVGAEEMHRSVLEIASLYGVVSSTHAWTEQVSRKYGAVAG